MESNQCTCEIWRNALVVCRCRRRMKGPTKKDVRCLNTLGKEAQHVGTLLLWPKPLESHIEYDVPIPSGWIVAVSQLERILGLSFWTDDSGWLPKA